MPEHDLREAYLERLAARMSLPDGERLAAAEEIAAHIDEAIADMQSRGLPDDVAERRALQHLGPPERLADDLTAARRQGSHVLSAVGTAIRISIITGLQYLLFTWAIIIILALAGSLVVAGIGRLVGTALLQADWTPLTAGLAPGVVVGAVVYGIGRTILNPVAVSARRPAAQVRLPLAVIGVGIIAWVAIGLVEAPYHAAGALLMASAPAWFLLGVLRHPARHVPVLVTPVLLFTLVVFVGIAGLAFAVGGSPGAVTSEASEPFDPNVEYAAIGPFADLEDPPLGFIESNEPLAQPGPGAGPVRVVRSVVAAPLILDSWHDLRLEVWPGPIGELNGSLLDPDATAPLATAPMTFDGRRLTAAVSFLPRPDRHNYYVATTGVDTDGVRMQLAWPGLEWWRWQGTVVDFVRASLQR